MVSGTEFINLTLKQLSMKKFLLVFLSVFFFAVSTFAQSSMNEELNPANLNPDFSTYDTKTALYLGQLSDLVYEDSVTIDSYFKEIKKLYPTFNHYYKFLDVKKSHTQALLWGTRDFVVVAFRGTEPSAIKDWVSDAKFWVYENVPDASVDMAGLPPGHGGFRKSAMRLIIDVKIFSEIRKLIKVCSPTANTSTFPIYLTGHSLGAAIAQLFIDPLTTQKFKYSGSYHFAPPLTVSCSERDRLRSQFGNIVYDIVNYKDYVPRAGRYGVAHFGKFYRICNDGLIYKERESYVKFNLREYFTEFNLHSLKNHLTAIRDVRNSAVEILTRSTGDFPCMELTEPALEPCAIQKE